MYFFRFVVFYQGSPLLDLLIQVLRRYLSVNYWLWILHLYLAKSSIELSELFEVLGLGNWSCDRFPGLSLIGIADASFRFGRFCQQRCLRGGAWGIDPEIFLNSNWRGDSERSERFLLR